MNIQMHCPRHVPQICIKFDIVGKLFICKAIFLFFYILISVDSWFGQNFSFFPILNNNQMIGQDTLWEPMPTQSRYLVLFLILQLCCFEAETKTFSILALIWQGGEKDKKGSTIFKGHPERSFCSQSMGG